MNLSNQKFVFVGAHPDDSEIRAGGLASLWRQHGGEVDYVSMTDGAAGHHQQSGAALVSRRLAEARNAAAIIGAQFHNLGLPDGEVEPTVVNRRRLVRLLRTLRPNLLITHRLSDYHPDHRYTSQLVNDASFLLEVPSFVPDIPPLRQAPAIYHCWDDFFQPRPLRADVAIDIDPVLDAKLAQMSCHASQFFEWLPWLKDPQAHVPADATERREMVHDWLLHRSRPSIAQRYRKVLAEAYGGHHANQVHFAEAFEACEYGRRLTEAEQQKLFPLRPPASTCEADSVSHGISPATERLR